MPNGLRTIGAAGALTLAAACAHRSSSTDEHAGHTMTASTTSTVTTATTVQPMSLPADASGAAARLASSTRHGEWVTVRNGASDSVRAWVVFPERSTKAPVVVVVHEIFGLQDWVRGVADQLAADGFIAIAPDLLTGMDSGWNGTASDPNKARAVIGSLDPTLAQQRITAVANYGMGLPAAVRKYGVVGYCWGGSTSFAHAAFAPELGASVVYYGSAPAPERLASVRAPVLGLYGGNDARINATLPRTDSAMKALGKTYVPIVYEGAGHGFLRQQSDTSGANMRATREAWPRTIAWFRQHLGA
jgi:carboxymethylenebutenolidase